MRHACKEFRFATSFRQFWLSDCDDSRASDLHSSDIPPTRSLITLNRYLCNQFTDYLVETEYLAIIKSHHDRLLFYNHEIRFILTLLQSLPVSSEDLGVERRDLLVYLHHHLQNKDAFELKIKHDRLFSDPDNPDMVSKMYRRVVTMWRRYLAFSIRLMMEDAAQLLHSEGFLPFRMSPEETGRFCRYLEAA